MRLYYKKGILYIGLTFVIIISSYIWNFISIPLLNKEGVIGYLTLKNFNPWNNSIRYFFFLTIPLLYYLVGSYLINKNKIINLVDLFKPYYLKNKDFRFADIKILFFIFIFLIFFDFLSTDLKTFSIDSYHLGDQLTPGINYLFYNNFWISSFLGRGSDIFNSLLAWKTFGSETIGSLQFLKLITIFLLKIFSIIFVYYLIQFFNFQKNLKVIFFTILSLILLSFSKFNDEVNYLTDRDIFVIIFLIFFIQCFNSKKKIIFNVAITLVSFSSLIFNTFDIGVYLLFVLFFYIFYLIFSRQFVAFTSIILSSLFFFIIFILIFSFSEFNALIINIFSVIRNIDLLHGLEHPQPFFYSDEIQHGFRASKALLLQLVAGLLILTSVIYKENNYSINQKVFLIFLYLLCIVSYKNALGRSDSYHIKLCSDLQSIIISFYILILIKNLFDKYKFINLNKTSSLIISLILILPFFFKNLNFENIYNFKNNATKFIYADDKEFLTLEYQQNISKIEEIFKDETCFQNFTEDLSIPYLIKKPTCTKYLGSWLASGKTLEADYIKILKIRKPKYILYSSPTFSFDNLNTQKRLKYVNEYIVNNYKPYKSFNGFDILSKK
jgi:hypothetical protein